MSQLHLIIYDNLDHEKEKKIVTRPRTFQELLQYLNSKNKLYELFIYDRNHNKIIINDENKYKLIKDIIFLKEIDNANKSIFSINYNKLSESKQEILDEKYNCNICSFIIKNENPYFCYKCQKIFHEKCLKEWDNRCKLQNKNLDCPICRNKLPIEKWNKKLRYEDNRIDNAKLLNKINEYKLDNNINNNLNLIKDEKIKYYENYINKMIITFKNILNKINVIYNAMKINNNNLVIQNLNDISNIINQELNNIYKNISNNKNIYNEINNNNKISNKLNEFNKNQINEYKNKINLIYYTKTKSLCDIFGENFVYSNKDNIELIINGKNNELINEYELKEGENIITLLIKNKLTDLSFMFYGCNNLKDISELKYLNVSEVKNFSYMFFKCSFLRDIKPLQNWNVSNGNDLSCMFMECSSLSDIKPLQNWNVSKVNNFSGMFYKCSSLSDIKPLQNWNVSKGNDFYGMFHGCSPSLSIQLLKNWKFLNNNCFDSIFDEFHSAVAVSVC